jgi:hypothetical protein
LYNSSGEICIVEDVLEGFFSKNAKEVGESEVLTGYKFLGFIFNISIPFDGVNSPVTLSCPIIAVALGFPFVLLYINISIVTGSEDPIIGSLALATDLDSNIYGVTFP